MWSYAFQVHVCLHVPTSPYTTLEPQNPRIDEFYVVRELRATDFKAPKLGKGSSGSDECVQFIQQILCLKGSYT